MEDNLKINKYGRRPFFNKNGRQPHKNKEDDQNKIRRRPQKKEEENLKKYGDFKKNLNSSKI